MEIHNRIFELQDSIRKRPGMYIGSIGHYGINNLIKGFLIQVLDLTIDEVFFTIEINSNFELKIQIVAKDISIKANDGLKIFNIQNSNIHYNALKALSNKFIYDEIDSNTININSKLDETIFKIESINFNYLSKIFTELTLLNNRCKIIAKDPRQQYLIQNYFFYINGIKSKFKDIVEIKSFGYSNFNPYFDKSKNNEIQVELAFVDFCYSVSPEIVSFANYEETIYHGDLVNGVLDGLIFSFKKHISEKKYSNYKITKKTVLNGLILVCSVKGDNFIWAGSSREKVESKEIRKQVKKIISDLFFKMLDNNSNDTIDLLKRFEIY